MNHTTQTSPQYHIIPNPTTPIQWHIILSLCQHQRPNPHSQSSPPSPFSKTRPQTVYPASHIPKITDYQHFLQLLPNSWTRYLVNWSQHLLNQQSPAQTALPLVARISHAQDYLHMNHQLSQTNTLLLHNPNNVLNHKPSKTIQAMLITLKGVVIDIDKKFIYTKTYVIT